MKGISLMGKYYSINEFSKILGVSAQTLRNWDKNGRLHPHHTITVFSCKLQGKRANNTRKLVKGLIENGGEDSDKNNTCNDAPKSVVHIRNFLRGWQNSQNLKAGNIHRHHFTRIM